MDEPGWRADGWNAQTRIGLLTPAGDVGPEAEFQAMAPPSVTVHAARVPFGAMRQRGAMDPTIGLEAVRAMAEPPGVDAAVELLALVPLQVIGFGFTSSSYVIGHRGEADMCARLSELGGGLPIVAAGAAMCDAAVRLEARRVFVVSPPWFDDQLADLGSQYVTGAGLTVVGAAIADLPRDQHAIAPAPLHSWLMANTPDDADASSLEAMASELSASSNALNETSAAPSSPRTKRCFGHALRRAGPQHKSSAMDDSSTDVAITRTI